MATEYSCLLPLALPEKKPVVPPVEKKRCRKNKQKPPEKKDEEKPPEKKDKEKPPSVEDLLAEFTSNEALDENNLYDCDCCGKKAKATTNLTVEEVRMFFCGYLRK